MLGLRAETQKILNDMGETVWSWGLGDFLSPRFSLAFDILGDGENILKFAYGQFANTIVTAKLLSSFTQNFFNPWRSYAWTGGTDPTYADLEDPANWEFVWEQSPQGSPMEVEPDLKPNKTAKFLLEFDRRLGDHWALELRGVYSSSKNLMEDLALYDPETLVKFVFANFELKRRDYRALEVELNGRIAGKFMLNAAYTWSQAKGTNPGNWVEWGTWQAIGGGFYDIGLLATTPMCRKGNRAKNSSIRFSTVWADAVSAMKAGTDSCPTV